MRCGETRQAVGCGETNEWKVGRLGSGCGKTRY